MILVLREPWFRFVVTLGIIAIILVTCFTFVLRWCLLVVILVLLVLFFSFVVL